MNERSHGSVCTPSTGGEGPVGGVSFGGSTMRERKIRSKVAGVTFRNADGTDRQKMIWKYCRVGMPLIAVREKKNRHSPAGTAIALYVPERPDYTTKDQAWQIGYIKGDLSPDVAEVMDSGGSATIVVIDVTGGGFGKSFGVNIQITLSESPPVPIPTRRKPDQPAIFTQDEEPTTGPPPLGHMSSRQHSTFDLETWLTDLAKGFARGLWNGYHRLPGWAQPIFWGLGAGLVAVAAIAALRTMR